MPERVFLDTNPIIYLIENRKPYVRTVRNLLIEKPDRRAEFYTSTITDVEILVHPYRTGDLSALEG